MLAQSRALDLSMVAMTLDCTRCLKSIHKFKTLERHLEDTLKTPRTLRQTMVLMHTDVGLKKKLETQAREAGSTQLSGKALEDHVKTAAATARWSQKQLHMLCSDMHLPCIISSNRGIGRSLRLQERGDVGE
jgi:hypothetical protein